MRGEEEEEETGIPDWVICVSERPHMGPRPIRRLVVGDTETPEEISCGHQRIREGKGQISKKRRMETCWHRMVMILLYGISLFVSKSEAIKFLAEGVSVP